MPKVQQTCWECAVEGTDENPLVSCTGAPRGCSWKLHAVKTNETMKRSCKEKHELQCVHAFKMRQELEEVTGRLDLGTISFKGKRKTLDKKLRPEQVTQLEKFIRDNVIGQELGIGQISNAYQRVCGGLSDPSKPLGIYLLMGPTGVGKTKIVEELSRFLYGNEMAGLVKISCSDSFKSYSQHLLEANPDDYENQDRYGNEITILLLDEFEKSSPSIRKALLSAMDKGKLFTSEDLMIDLSRTLILMTSNLAGQEVSGMVEGLEDISPELYAEMFEMCMKACLKEFSPEFFNRLDGVIMFHPLTKPMIVDIVALEIILLEERMHRLRVNIRLNVDRPALEKLVRDTFDIRYGARPLKRKIEAELVTPIASFLASKQLSKGDRVVVTLTGKGKAAEYNFEKVVGNE